MTAPTSAVTENHVKEGLSIAYVECLAAKAAYVVESARTDYGTDLTVRVVEKLRVQNKTSYFTGSKHVALQLKATTESKLRAEGNFVKYALRAKNYNHLVHWWKSAPSAPKFVIVLALPDSKDDWVSLDTSELCIRRRAFWWRPNATDDYTSRSSITISIPSAQLLTVDFFDQRLKEFYA